VEGVTWATEVTIRFGGNPGHNIRVSVGLGLRLDGSTAILQMKGYLLPGICLMVTILQHQHLGGGI